MKNDKLAIKTFSQTADRIDEFVNGWLRDNLDLGNVDVVSINYLNPTFGGTVSIYHTVVIEYKY